MEASKERAPISQKKYALIAHEREVDKYILTDENGNLEICNEEKLNKEYLYKENLVSFTTLARIWQQRGRAAERPHTLRPDLGDVYVWQKTKEIITRAVEELGHPPKERIEFFSVPKQAVRRLDWIPRKR